MFVLGYCLNSDLQFIPFVRNNFLMRLQTAYATWDIKTRQMLVASYGEPGEK